MILLLGLSEQIAQSQQSLPDWSATYTALETRSNSTHCKLSNTKISPWPLANGSKAFPMIVPGR
jgi:hypothetical protein